MVVMSAPIAVVPETDRFVTPVIAPLITALPVMAYTPLPTKVLLLVVVAAVILVAPNASELPTVPVKVTVPEPAPMVRALAEELLFNVEAKAILLLVVFSVVAAPRVTASL